MGVDTIQLQYATFRRIIKTLRGAKDNQDFLRLYRENRDELLPAIDSLMKNGGYMSELNPHLNMIADMELQLVLIIPAVDRLHNLN